MGNVCNNCPCENYGEYHEERRQARRIFMKETTLSEQESPLKPRTLWTCDSEEENYVQEQEKSKLELLAWDDTEFSNNPVRI